MTELTQLIMRSAYSRSDALYKLHALTLSNLTGKIKGIDEKNFDETVQKSEEEIKNIPILTLFVAKEIVDIGGEKRIGEIVRREVAGFDQENQSTAQFLLDFRVDPTLVAGCAIVWNGKMKNFSLKRKIEENLEEIRKIVIS